jgi:hypothetical protein
MNKKIDVTDQVTWTNQQKQITKSAHTIKSN